MVERGSIVQITDEDHEWFPCLAIVDKLREGGCMGYVSVPMKGPAYIMLEKTSYELVGEAVIICQ